MHEDVGDKITQEVFDVAMTELSGVNEALCAENCVARWLWKSG